MLRADQNKQRERATQDVREKPHMYPTPSLFRLRHHVPSMSPSADPCGPPEKMDIATKCIRMRMAVVPQMQPLGPLTLSSSSSVGPYTPEIAVSLALLQRRVLSTAAILPVPLFLLLTMTKETEGTDESGNR